MITINKGNTHNKVVTTLYEKLSCFGLSGSTGDTYFYNFVNDLTNEQTIIGLQDTSPNPWRYNKFTVDETQFDFVPGLYSYSASTSSGFTYILETGRLTVSGTNTDNSVYW